MRTTLLFQPEDGERLRWFGVGGDVAGVGGVAELAKVAGDADLTMVVPAHHVLVREVSFEAHERRLLRHTVPYALEEQLVDDVDEQHFALGPIDSNRVAVAVVKSRWLADWLARCTSAGLEVKRALPEQLLLPWRDGCWTLRVEPERWLVRCGLWRGFALEPEAAALALQLLLDEGEQLPERLLVCGVAPETVQMQLPELLRSIAVAESASPALPSGQPLLDLLQGAFARVLPWRRWWRDWRWPVAMLGVALVAQFVVAGVTHLRLEQQNLALRRQIEQTYRSVVPKGAVVNPESQLRRQVAALQGTRSGALVPLLQQVGSSVVAIPGVKLQNLSYSDRQAEIRVNLQTDSFKDVEAVRQSIAGKGLDAQLVGSSADGGKTRAQLRIMERR